jgi:hypothetical protein
MNCLSHAFQYLSDPMFAAGTCIPDWLGMINRRVRVRRPQVQSFLRATDERDGRVAVAHGIARHLQDDDSFHNAVPFLETCNSISKLMREHCPDSTGHRSAFVGHIVTELLLDASIEADQPGTMERYYQAIELVPAPLLESTVNAIASRPIDDLARFMDKYLSSRFLFDYLTDDGLMHRMNGILQRVTLEPIPEACQWILCEARGIVYARRLELLQAVG